MRGIRRAGLLALAASSALASAAAAAPTFSDCEALSTGPSAVAKRICDYVGTREGVVQVALFDHRTGRSYRISTGPNKQLTASVAKVDILAEWLHGYQQRRTRIPAGIPYSIRYLMEREIEFSDNAAATGLFYFHGGCRALSRFNVTVPMPATKVGCQTPTYYGWGNTTTTAADQARLMRLIAYGGRPRVLGPAARQYALGLLKSVEPGQNWGISCGPWTCSAADTTGTGIRPGTTPVKGTTVALKNGWKTLPSCRRAIAVCPWQINSSGWVRGRGRDYVLTVLTTEDPVGTGKLFGYNYGADTIQAVSAIVWAALSPR